MPLILLIFGGVVLAMLGAYLLLDSRMRRSDLETIKSRLLGTAAKTAKTSTEISKGTDKTLFY